MNNIGAESFRFPISEEIEALVAQASRAGNADAEQISAMCSIAGKPDMIPGFLSGKASAGQGIGPTDAGAG